MTGCHIFRFEKENGFRTKMELVGVDFSTGDIELID
jgi:hypothetical protein